jgi:hypothetical protein
MGNGASDKIYNRVADAAGRGIGFYFCVASDLTIGSSSPNTYLCGKRRSRRRPQRHIEHRFFGGIFQFTAQFIQQAADQQSGTSPSFCLGIGAVTSILKIMRFTRVVDPSSTASVTATPRCCWYVRIR